MLIENVNSNRVNAYQSTTVQEKESTASVFQEGQIISGTVTKVSEQVTMDFAGRSVNFSKESVKNAQEGQVRRFQVVRVDTKGVTLKEIGAEADTKTSGTSFTRMDAMAGAVVKEQAAVEETAEEEEDPEEIAERMTEEDYRDLASEGFTLEGYNLERLARALERIKNDRAQKQEEITQTVEKQTKVREEIRRIAKEQKIPGATALADYLVQLFARADIPVTAEKVEEAVQAVQLGQNLGSLEAGAKAYLMRNELEPDIQNLYRAVHSGERENVQPMADSTWEELQPAVENVLRQAGREQDLTAQADARWLVERDIPLTPENLAYKQELDEISAKLTTENILERVAASWQKGQSAEKALVGDTLQDLKMQAQVRAYQQEFADIRPETVDAAVQALKAQENGTGELSLSFLKRMQEQLEADAGDVTIQDVTARRQLAEIQLKLTTEAGVKLLARGIRLDTDGLEQIVEGLRNLEQEYYEKLYQEAGGTVSEATRGDIELLAQTQNAVNDVKNAPAYVLGATFTARNIQTVDTLAETGRGMTAEFSRAGQTYEAVMTKPRADMGDSIYSAFRSMDSLMQEMGLEQTEANRRAIRILSYNQLELSDENIQEMKLYDAKVQQLLDGLNPAATVSLIRKNINPLEMPLDELNGVLQQLQEEGATTEEKYSNYLVKLDQKKELTKEERDSYIGIYRLLHQVTKTDGAAIGAVVNSGRQMTLANLLSAVRTGRTGVDANIDDAFGGLEQLNQRGTDILLQAGAAFSYQRGLAESILKDLTPEKLAAVSESGQDPEQMSLEQLKEAMAVVDNTAEEEQYAAVKLAQLNAAAEDSAEELAFLSAFGQEKTIAALESAKELLSADSTKNRIRGLAEKYQTDLAEAFMEPELEGTAMENAENMKKQVEKWNESADKVIDELFQNTSLSGEDSLKLLSLKNTIQLSGRLAEREFYEIPLQSESGFVKLNLTVLHSAGQSGKVSIHLKQEDGTDVAVELSVEERKLQGYVSTASREGLGLLQQKETQIKENLMEQGFEVAQWNYGLKTRSADSYIYKDGSIYRRSSVEAAEAKESGVTRTDDLYLAAKTIIRAFSAN